MSDQVVHLGKKGTKTLYPTRRRSGGKKRPANRFESECDKQGVSASVKKLKNCNEEFDVNSEEVYQAIKPIYTELSRDDLLQRCLGGYTQNNNESFNATVWSLAPKSFSSGKTVLDIATDIAVCNFNGGLKNVLQIIKVLEMEIGVQSYNFCIEADAKRIKHAEASLSDAAKDARALNKSTRKDEEDEFLAIEGQLYGPGIAD